jgi:hypothetical protein
VVTVPPAVVPAVILRLLTDGAVALEYVKWSLLEVADVPLGVITVTSTVPAASGGDTAVNRLSVLTMKLVTGMLPKTTAVAPLKPLPFTATVVPPAVVPVVVPRLVTTGGGAATYVKRSPLLGDDTPAGFSTVTSIVPAGSGGSVTVIDVLELIVKSVTGMLPK